MKTVGTLRRSVQRRLALGVAGLTTVMLALSLGLSAPARAQVTGTVVIYEHINYGGLTRSFGAGSYSNIGSEWNDRASSIRVPAGTLVSVYEHGAFGGRCENFRANDGDLRDNPIGNDTITSLMVGQGCPARLWDHGNYGGSFVAISGDIPNLGTSGFSDRAESLQVAPGSTVALYDLPNYGGLCEAFTGDDPNFNNNPMRQRASSLRVNAGCAVQGVIFDGTNYEGDYLIVAFRDSPANPYFANQNLPPAWSARASSVSVAGGAFLEIGSRTVVLENGIFKGTVDNCQRFTAPDPDLGNNRVGSDTATIGGVHTGVPFPDFCPTL